MKIFNRKEGSRLGPPGIVTTAATVRSARLPAQPPPLRLEEANAAVRSLLERLNARPMRRLGASRRELFERLEGGTLLELPPEPFEYAEWRRCRIGLDYHVEVLGHWYSVPHRLARAVVDARVTERGVELFHNGGRVAAHPRSPLRHRHTTTPDHMPCAHRRHADWTPARLRRDAAAVGVGAKTGDGHGAAAVATVQVVRCDTGMPSRAIRLSTEQATLASVLWAGRVRARRLRPMMVLYRNTAVSPSERLP